MLNFIKRKGAVSPKEIADYLGISTQAVHKHLRYLLNEEILLKKGSAPKVKYSYNSKHNSQVEKDRAKLHRFLLKNRALFWDIAEEDLASLSKESIIERIVELGNSSEVKFITQYFQDDLEGVYQHYLAKYRSNLNPESLAFLKNYIQYNVSSNSR